MLFESIFFWLSLIKNTLSIVYTCDLLNQSIINIPVLRGTFLRSLKIENFNSFGEIKINCDKNFQDLYTIEIVPDKRLILNQELNLTGLIVNNGMSNILYISNIKAIEANTDTTFGLSKQDDYRTLYFDYSNFEFYLNNKPFSTNDCLSYEFKTNFFTNIDDLYLKPNLIYSQKVCPILLSNSKLSQIRIFGITNSFINKNKFEFMEIDEERGNDVYLGSFQFLYLFLTYTAISKQIVNQYVFRSMETLMIEGLIYEIEHEFQTSG